MGQQVTADEHIQLEGSAPSSPVPASIEAGGANLEGTSEILNQQISPMFNVHQSDGIQTSSSNMGFHSNPWFDPEPIFVDHALVGQSSTDDSLYYLTTLDQYGAGAFLTSPSE